MSVSRSVGLASLCLVVACEAFYDHVGHTLGAISAAVALVGAILNALVLSQNGWEMPVIFFRRQASGHIPLNRFTRLWFLGDIIHLSIKIRIGPRSILVRSPYMSIGDILIYSGGIPYGVHGLMHVSRELGLFFG